MVHVWKIFMEQKRYAAKKMDTYAGVVSTAPPMALVFSLEEDLDS